MIGDAVVQMQPLDVITLMWMITATMIQFAVCMSVTIHLVLFVIVTRLCATIRCYQQQRLLQRLQIPILQLITMISSVTTAIMKNGAMI